MSYDVASVFSLKSHEILVKSMIKISSKKSEGFKVHTNYLELVVPKLLIYIGIATHLGQEKLYPYDRSNQFTSVYVQYTYDQRDRIILGILKYHASHISLHIVNKNIS